MIRKVKGGWRVVAEDGPSPRRSGLRPRKGGRNMETYRSKKAAKERLRQIEVFKHLKKRGKR